MGWIILGGFLAYWYILKKHTTQSLIETIRNDLSGFSQYNQAGLPTGAILNPGTHEGYPGDTTVPLGITSANPGSMFDLVQSQSRIPAVASQLGTVDARGPSPTGPVGFLVKRPVFTKPRTRTISVAPRYPGGPV